MSSPATAAKSVENFHENGEGNKDTDFMCKHALNIICILIRFSAKLIISRTQLDC